MGGAWRAFRLRSSESVLAVEMLLRRLGSVGCKMKLKSLERMNSRQERDEGEVAKKSSASVE